MNKRGLSAIVATLLIVLITIAAVLLVWNVVKKNLEQSSAGLSKADCVKIDLNIDKCNSTNGNVILSYNAGSVSKLVVTVENSTTTGVKSLTGTDLPILGSKKAITPIPTITSATKASVTAFLTGSNGEEIACGLIDEQACS